MARKKKRNRRHKAPSMGHCTRCGKSEKMDWKQSKRAAGASCSSCGGNLVQRRFLTSGDKTTAEPASKPVRAKAGEVVINFGKHAGTKFRDIPTDYLQWLRTIDGRKWAKTAAREELIRRSLDFS